MFEAIRQTTREDYPFDWVLHDGYGLADKGLSREERAELHNARIKLLLCPKPSAALKKTVVDEAIITTSADVAAKPDQYFRQLEEEELALQRRAINEGALSEEELKKLSRSSDSGRLLLDKSLEQAEEELLEAARLTLNAEDLARLIEAQEMKLSEDAWKKLSEYKNEVQEKAWKGISDEQRQLLTENAAKIPVEEEAQESCRRRQADLEEIAIASLSDADRTRLERIKLQEKAFQALSKEERKTLAQSPEAKQRRADAERLQAQAAAALSPGQAELLRVAKLLELRDSIESEKLSEGERRALDGARRRLRLRAEGEALAAQAEANLSPQQQAQLAEVRERLKVRDELKILREKADGSLDSGEREQLQRVRAGLRLTPLERRQLHLRVDELSTRDLSSAKNSFARGLSEVDGFEKAAEYLDQLLKIAPFNTMLDQCVLDGDEPGATRLCEILLRDTRIREFSRNGEKREVVVRQGDYGGSAFLILDGVVRILIQSDEQARKSASSLGAKETRQKSTLSLLLSWLGGSAGREVRKNLGSEDERYQTGGRRRYDKPIPIVVKNFAALPGTKNATLAEGEVIGEIGALTRIPRTATVVPETPVVRMLEIRWQGLRDLMGLHDAFREYVEAIYRRNSLRGHLLSANLLTKIGDTKPIRDCIETGNVTGVFCDHLGWVPRSGATQFELVAVAPPPLPCQLAAARRGGSIVRVPMNQRHRDTEFRIGGKKGSDLTLLDGQGISKEHAVLRFDNGRWFLRNRSKHGTLIANRFRKGGLPPKQVRKEVVLLPGDEIWIGEDYRIRFEVAGPQSEPDASAAKYTIHYVGRSAQAHGTGGFRVYQCELGQAALPDVATCELVERQLTRREYTTGVYSDHILVFTRSKPGGQATQKVAHQHWVWRLPMGSGSHRYDGDPGPLATGLVRMLAYEEVFQSAELLSHGKFKWYERSGDEDFTGTKWDHGLEGQPVIAQQGHYPNGVFLIRAGFGLVTEQTDQGERTVSYLRPHAPYPFGLEQIVTNWLRDRDTTQDTSAESRVLPYTLRAIGYADTIFIPTPTVERFVLPAYPEADLKAMLDADKPKRPGEMPRLDRVPENVDPALRDFLVRNHIINGRQAMVLNLDRCTRCDDCVRGCASSHGEDPRFLRHGRIHGNLMVVNACMHCVDPVCLLDCPTGAIHRTPGEAGRVVINDSTCIGCTACAHNCPYDNIRMVNLRGKKEDIATAQRVDEHGAVLAGAGAVQVRATKCDLCSDTGSPACVAACPHDALKRYDLSTTAALGDLATWLS